MEQIIPKIANVTDLRYRWSQLAKELEENDLPILVMEHSTPKAVIFSVSQAQKLIGRQRTISPQDDPLVEWRKKNAHKFAGWDATKAIRKMRETRWSLS